MATRRNRNQRSRRNRNQTNRQRNRRGSGLFGDKTYEDNKRNCEEYWHRDNKSFCTTPSPDGGDIPINAIDYPGIMRKIRGDKPKGKYGRSAGQDLDPRDY
jgi:hypothetical protein